LSYHAVRGVCSELNAPNMTAVQAVFLLCFLQVAPNADFSRHLDGKIGV
jgi:hypothetical protein